MVDSLTRSIPSADEDLAEVAHMLGLLSKGEREWAPAVAAMLTTQVAKLPPIVSAEQVARLLEVDAKVIYSAVSELGLPLRPVGRRKCLRGLTIAVLLWIAGGWPPSSKSAVDSASQGRVVQARKGRR